MDWIKLQPRKGTRLVANDVVIRSVLRVARSHGICYSAQFWVCRIPNTRRSVKETKTATGDEFVIAACRPEHHAAFVQLGIELVLIVAEYLGG